MALEDKLDDETSFTDDSELADHQSNINARADDIDDALAALQAQVNDLQRMITVIYCHQQYQNNPHGPDDPLRTATCEPGPENNGGGNGNNGGGGGNNN